MNTSLKVLTFFIVLVFFIGASSTTPLSTHASPVDSCSCSAPDGSCSASVNCQGGCIRFCGNNNNCSAECSGAYSDFALEVTFELDNATYPQLLAELSRFQRKEVVFSPIKPDLVFNAGFKRAVLWDVLRFLSDRGTLSVGGKDFEKFKTMRNILLSGERIAFCVTNTPVSTVISDLGGLTGLTFRIKSGRPMATVNAQLPNANLNEIVTAISEQTGTKITYADVEIGGN